jgi:hypothetical protein
MASPARWARIAGICWLIAIVTGMFAEALVRSPLMTGNPASTLANILASQDRYRLAGAAMFAGTAAYLALSAILYRLFAPLSRTISSIALLFSVIGCTVWMLTLVIDAVPLLLANSPGADSTLVRVFLALHPEALLLGMLCFGVQCLLVGCLITRASFLPKWLGVLLAIGGVGYIAAGFLHLVAPDLGHSLARWTFIPGEAGELALGGWLTIAGVNSERWRAQAGQAASRNEAQVAGSQ